jgi:CBS domain-containing protein
MEEILVKSIMTTAVETVDASDSLSVVGQRMKDKKISCVIVTGSNGPEGIITERDMVRLLATNSNFRDAEAREAMNAPLDSVPPNLEVEEAIQRMKQNGHRRFPVVNGKRELLGLVTQTDLIRAYSTVLEREIAKRTSDLIKRLTELTEMQDRMLEMARKAATANVVITVAHEVNNPLTAISGYAERGLASCDKKNSQYRYFDAILLGACRIKEVLGKIQNIRRLETTTYAGNLDMLDISKCANTLFGEYLVQNGLASYKAVTKAWLEQRERNKSISQLAYENGMLALDDVTSINLHQQLEGKTFEETAVDMKLLTPRQVRKLKEQEAKTHVYIGQILVEMGVISEEELTRELETFRKARTKQDPRPERQQKTGYMHEKIRKRAS